MPQISFTDQQVQQLQNILGEIPWKIAHPLLVAIALSTQKIQETLRQDLPAQEPIKGNNHDADRPADQS